MSTLESIINRYQEESSNIFQYVMYTILAFGREKNVIVEGVTDDDSTRDMLNHFEVNFVGAGEAEEKNQQIVQKMKEIIIKEKNKTSAYLDENDKRPIPNELQNLKIVNAELGLVEYLNPSYDNLTYDEYMEQLSNMTAISLKEEIDNDPSGRPYYGDLKVNDYEKLLEYARLFYYNEHIEDLITHEIHLNELLNSYHVMDYKHPINIYRQSFILLLTTLDAAVFDAVEIIIKADFFVFIKASDDMNESFKLKDIVQTGSFDTFQENIIKNILKQNYATGLLKMLYKYNKNYFVVNGTDQYRNICEIIARRNLHIHKRGIVDQGYFEQSQGNPFGLSCGDIAYIKGSYYLYTTELLLSLLTNFQVIFES